MKKGLLFISHESLSTAHSPALRKYISSIARAMKGRQERYDTREEALRLPRDARIIHDAKKMAKRFADSRLKYVIVIGIGGSNLGAKAVYDALRGNYDLAFPGTPKLIFLDTLSRDTIERVDKLLKQDVTRADELVINLISKSGTTTESIANFELLRQALRKRFPGIDSRVVCTTDRGSALWKKAEQCGFLLLPIPEFVGGRFSVFSSVGIFPLLLAGINVDQFRKGGAGMLDAVINRDRAKNPAQQAAEELFAALRSKHPIFNIFHFNPELESLGKWERQLIAESLGKERDLKGKIVRAGITPIVSIGSTDLHSMAQLYFGGPRDKYTMLIRADDRFTARIPNKGTLSSLVEGIDGKNPTELLDAIYAGVCSAYREHALPYAEVKLPSLSEYALGAYMEWRMATVIYLAQLTRVNPFDQPNVEDYKKVTRLLLRKKLSRRSAR